MIEDIINSSSRINRRKKTASLALHALFIGIIFVLPEALLRVAIPDRTLDITWPMYAKSFITIAVFYLNYFIIIPSALKNDSRLRWKFFLWNFLTVVIGAVAIWYIYNVIYTGPRRYAHSSSLASMSYILRDSIILVLAISLAVALRVSQRWLDLEERHQRLISVRRQSELDSLRSQLNPHFLFNTLNTIYALIEINPEHAQKAIHDLSALLRYVVYDNPRVVPLDREIEFVKNYVELRRLRMGERPVELVVERRNDSHSEIAPLLFVTLVENAFKHGNTTDTTLPISIRITSDGEDISCSTKNFTDNHLSEDSNKGVGLNNLKRRIELLYGDGASLETSLNADGTYSATLRIKSKIINPVNF